MAKRIIPLLLALVLACTFIPTAFASDQMEDSSYYTKQQRSGTCTLASAVMMLRRRAYLDGDAEYRSITESSLKRAAWSNGLLHNFTYNGMTVGYGTLSGSSEEKQAALAELLAAHPEGIVAYDRSSPHAILLTDYTDGTFYCSDPSGATGYGRMPASWASISLSRVTGYWYVSADANEQLNVSSVDTLTLQGLFYPENIRTGSSFNLGGIVLSAEGTELTGITIKLVDEAGNVVQSASDTLEAGTTEWAFRNLNREITFGSLPAGRYGFSFVVSDSAGKTLCFARTFTVSDESTLTRYYWTAQDAA